MPKTLQKIRNAIVSGYHPDKIILFGSRVWGKPHRWSDYDLLVLKKNRKQSMIESGMKVRRIIRNNNIWAPMDILVYNQKELKSSLSGGNQLFEDILQNGKIIYEKQ